MLFLRALSAFLVLPGIVAGILPLWLLRGDRSHSHGTIFGWPMLAFGLLILLWCVRDFYTIGRGTLAPWDPPKKLVILGLYRVVRNPMYIGVLGILMGWVLLTGSRTLVTYTVIVAIGFHLRVILYEEPKLATLFGDDWTHYRSRVNRWLPKRPLRVQWNQL